MHTIFCFILFCIVVITTWNTYKMDFVVTEQNGSYKIQ